jgi:nucleoside-diphosphate-sugar epimerase
MLLEDKQILVTGATGFIGGHLAQRLALIEGAIVTGTGRDLDKASYLNGLGIQLRKLEIRDKQAVRELVQGQDIVFHLVAAPGTSPLDVAQDVNVAAAENLVQEAAAVGVSRFVHISSMAAYGPPDRPVINEDCPLDVEQSARYGQTKALGELAVREAAMNLGLDFSIIRPGMVFGPRGRSWTINLFKLVKKGVPVILGDGDGLAQPVYIDNLLDGMILAGTRPEAVGHAFNFVDQPLPWKELFAYYGAMCGRKPRRLPLWLFRGIAALVIPFLGRSESIDDILTFYTSQSVYPMEKAGKLLGYRPRVSLDEGMRRTEEWLREAGYL